MDRELKKAIILENYQNPKNRGLVDDKDYNIVHADSKSCIDHIDLQFKIDDDKISDIRFDGEACAICTSSTSILVKTLLGKTIDESLDIINNFENMIEEREYIKEKLGEAEVYSDIASQPNRKNCALLTWNGLKKDLEVLEKK